ncbi:hypothetical protein [Azospirillum sp. INR13]|uniref:hypothetical protein n=1 Tax=Azospirillum sp. INR13 TaxID=2596919 RepID=UPI0019D62147|nr:hypothetical protein [Azospirillum sp. INR13]
MEKKSRILILHERSIVAHHEMGHALVAMAIPGSDPIQKGSIIPRGIGAVCYDTEPGHLPGQPQGAFWQPRHCREASASRIDAAVRALVETAASRASDILRRNHAVLEQGAKRLLERETLTADELPLPESAGAEGHPEASESSPAAIPVESKVAAKARSLTDVKAQLVA